MVRHEFQHTTLVSYYIGLFGNHTNLFCHAVIVGN